MRQQGLQRVVGFILGEAIDDIRFHILQIDITQFLLKADIPRIILFRGKNDGIVARIDAFGNIITNIFNQQKEKYVVEIDDKRLEMNFYPNYALAKDNELFLVEGSNNTLEISLKNASANDKLHAKTGQRVIIS